MASRGKRIAALLILGLAAALSAVFYTQFFLARPIGSGPAGPPVDRAAFSDTWTERSVCLIGLGDSVTAGLGAASREH